MAIAAEYNTRIDTNTDYVFDWLFTEDDDVTPIDISTWTFNFKMRDSNGTLVWDILNGDFGRPSTGVITFTKTYTELQSIPTGLYSIELLVTKTGVLNDQYVCGYYQLTDQC